MFSLIGLNRFKRFKHDSSEGSLGLNIWRLNIGGLNSLNITPCPTLAERKKARSFQTFSRRPVRAQSGWGPACFWLCGRRERAHEPTIEAKPIDPKGQARDVGAEARVCM